VEHIIIDFREGWQFYDFDRGRFFYFPAVYQVELGLSWKSSTQKNEAVQFYLKFKVKS
jgi:hypothetical protein